VKLDEFRFNKYHTDSSTKSLIRFSLFFRSFYSFYALDDKLEDLLSSEKMSWRMDCRLDSSWDSYSGTRRSWLSYLRIYNTSLSIL
jgi:hypothetical protein